MKTVLKNAIKDLPSSFSTNELAYYALTNKFELHIRDKIAFKLHCRLKNLYVKREFKNTDISIHYKDIHKRPKAVIEIKYGTAASFLRKKDKSRSLPIVGIVKDIEKSRNIGETFYGLIFLSHLKSEIGNDYSFLVNNINLLNNYCAENINSSNPFNEIKKDMRNFLPTKDFSLSSGVIQAGQFSESSVEIYWFMYSTRN